MKRYFRRIGIAFACDWANDYLDAIKKLDYAAWFVIIVSGITGFTSFSIDLDIMDFFKYRLDLSNREAGTLFGAQGIPTLIVGLIASLLIDKLGLKVSLILGSLFACIFGIQLALSDNKFLIETVVSFGLPFASIMLSIPLSISAGRIVASATKALCFMMQYWANNVGDVIAAFVNPMLKAGSGLGQFEKVFGLTAISYFFLSLFILVGYKEPPVTKEVKDPSNGGNLVRVYEGDVFLDSDVTESSEEGPLVVEKDEQLEVEITTPRNNSIVAKTLMPILELVFSRSLWRCLTLSFVFMWARMPFMHMMTIIPIYMQNIYGLDVNYSLAIATNPEILTVCLWLVSVRLSNVKNVFSLMFMGTLVVALSPLPMIFWRGTSQVPVYLAMTLQTIGEMMFSPLLDMVVNDFAPNDHKALYRILAGLPHVFGRLFAGVEAGFLLDTFCPSPISENYDHWSTYSCANLWIPVSLFALLTPLLIPLAQPFIQSKRSGMICTRSELDDEV